MRFCTWLKQLDTVTGAMVPAFGTFVAAQVQLAGNVMVSGSVTLEPPPDVDPQDSKCESRLILMLIRCSQEWKTSVPEQNESKGMTRSFAQFGCNIRMDLVFLGAGEPATALLPKLAGRKKAHKLHWPAQINSSYSMLEHQGCYPSECYTLQRLQAFCFRPQP